MNQQDYTKNQNKMTPKEKAEELVEAFMNIRKQKLADYSIIYHPTAKQCALIAVDEILKDLKESLEVAEDLHPHAKGLIAGSLTSWQQVKQEIEQL
jgi:hypothetical protein